MEFRLGWRAVATSVEPGGGLVVEGIGVRVEVYAVVLTVLHDLVGGLLPDGALPDPAAPARLGASPIVNLHVVYDRPVTELGFAAAVDSPVQWIFDPENYQMPKTSSCGQIITRYRSSIWPPN